MRLLAALLLAIAILGSGCEAIDSALEVAGGGSVSVDNKTNGSPLVLSASKALILVNTSVVFTPGGGHSPYKLSLVSGSGTFTPSTGVYQASASPEIATVRVTDFDNNVFDAVVIVNPLVSMQTSAITMTVENSYTFKTVGGLPPYSFSILAGGGSLNSSTGEYSAPAATGSATIQVTDGAANTANSTVTIVDALAISPTSVTLSVNNATTFTGTNGVGSRRFSIASGGGSINASSGAFVAPSTSGTVVVRVTDDFGNAKDATVTVTPAIAISPSSKTLAVNNSATFTASGGVGPYTFSKPAGGGSIVAGTGVYTAPGAAGTATVRVTDSLSNTSDATITINAALAISPAAKTLAVGNSHTFSASGGVAPYTYSITAGGGTINASTGAYTAPGAAGSATVRVTDSLNNTSDATVTINAALAVNPSSKTVAVNNTYTFGTTGGVAPFTFTMVSGGGSINSGSGLYTAPATSGSAVIRVTDSLSNTATSAVTINPALAISPSTKTLAVSNTHTFSASDGVSGYTYSVVAGGGSVHPTSGLYTAPGAAGTATVRVTDTMSNTSDATVTINAALAISPTSITLGPSNSYTFSGSNGVSPYTFSVFAGGGSINSTTGVYTAPASAGAVTVRVSDSLGNTADSSVTINSALAISPTSKTLAVGNTFTFSAANGSGTGYAYSVVAGGGSINSATGLYTAPGSAGSATIRVTDSLGNTSDAAVTINAALAISPSTKTMAVDNSHTFSASNGVAPYSYSITGGSGAINAATGAYTAPNTAGAATVTVTDSLGNTANATVTINAALAISPTSKTLAVTNTHTFTASGGDTSYTFSVAAGGGTVHPTTGLYTAPNSSGAATVRVTDGMGNTADAAVTINAAPSISPSTKTVAVNNTFTFSATNGVAPYSYSVAAGAGTIHNTTGLYTAPGAPGSATLRVTDSLGNTSDATVTVAAALSASPSTKTLAVNNTFTFSGSDGSPPYSYSVVAGGGTVNSSTGLYTAPAASGSATVRVTDSMSNTADATVTINDALGISPSSKTLAVGNSTTFAGTDGVAPYSYSVFAGGGTINSGTGVYTAPGVAGSATVRVTDSLGNTSDAAVTTNSALAISPTSKTILINGTHTFTASNGVPSYSYSVFAGSGTVGAVTGTYTAPGTTGSATVRVIDSIGNTSNAAVTIARPSKIAAGGSHVCALLTTGEVKCWGYNFYGQLGLGDTTNRGTNSSQMSSALAIVDLGAGRTATDIVAGENHTCALLDNNTVKCWGYNAFGQLGQGDTNNRGDAASEMGDSLSAIQLGTGRTATAITAGGNHTCAILDNATAKCWGKNTNGQLGLGDTTDRGTAGGQMGSSLAAISLGTGRTALSIAAGQSHTCARLDNSSMKCWGANGFGQLGQGDTTERGSAGAQMGDALLAISLGTLKTVSAVAVGANHSCAILNDSTLKCFGYNAYGQLGQEDTTNYGSAGLQMGDSLAEISLGTLRTASSASCGENFTCALLDNSSAKCWGYNNFGQLGQGDTNNRGDAAAEMGDNLTALSLGTGRTALQIAAGGSHACALLDDYTVKCWGYNVSGQLGYGDTTTRGSAGAQMGDSLGAVSF